ncbi:MAG: hypothetical protein KGN01_06490 [Patescibacteria group bacterium]|nr:hypothetical protein [Patescibacteria group bacterium]
MSKYDLKYVATKNQLGNSQPPIRVTIEIESSEELGPRTLINVVRKAIQVSQFFSHATMSDAQRDSEDRATQS